VHSRLRFTALLLLWFASACFFCPSAALPPTVKSEKTAGRQLDPKAAEMHESLGDALRIKGDLNGAMAEYRAALQLNPDFVNAHIGLGTTMYLYGDVNGAVSEYQAAIRLAPNDAIAHHNLAATLKTRGDEKGAISEYQTASRLDPSSSYTLDRLASLYATASDATLRNPSKSLEYALQAVKLDDAKNPSHLNTLAEAYYVNHEYKNAVLTEKKALAHPPDDATRKSLEASLAKYELTLGEPSAGEALALPIVPAPVQAQTSEFANAARAPYEKGLEAVKQQDWNLAVSNFLAAQEADPESPAILFNLGLVSEKITGHELRAIAWFQAYLMVAPAAPDATAVRNEVARLEVSYEAKNRLILDGIDSFILLAKTNVDQLSKERGPEWAKFASLEMRDAAELQAGSRYFVADENGALRVLHGVDETLFRDGSLDLPFPSPLLPASRDMASAMLSSGLNVEEVVYGAKPRDFTESEVAQLDYLLEAGDLAHAWTFLSGWPPNNATWILGAERFLCTAHDRSDSIMLDKAWLDIQKALAGSLAVGWAYSDFVRLYLEMGEVSRAEALAKAIPSDLERQTLQSYELAADKRVIAGTANGLLEDFHQRRIQSQGRCSGELSVLMESSPNSQTLKWGRGPWVGGGTSALWWSTGRTGFLTSVGRHGVKNESSSDFDETRLSEYVKKVSAEILPNPNLVAVGAAQLAGFEFRVLETYRQLRGPVRSNADAHNNRRIGYENQGLYDRAHYSKPVALGAAAAQGHLDEVRYWVARGADVNARDDKGITPLHRGAVGGHLDVVQYLVAQGANVKVKGSDGSTVLHSTVLLKGNLDVVQYLVAHGADVNARDKEGSMPLYNAALAGSLAVVQYLATHGADVRATNNDGLTALHVAALGHLDVAQYLVSHGAEVNARDKEGSTPLLFAVYNGQLDVAQYLVDNGADVNARDKDGSTALGNAQKQGNLVMVQYLTAHGGRQ
jgi:ankyrin repeat protein/Flp pilus assembly protein TadD